MSTEGGAVTKEMSVPTEHELLEERVRKIEQRLEVNLVPVVNDHDDRLDHLDAARQTHQERLEEHEKELSILRAHLKQSASRTEGFMEAALVQLTELVRLTRGGKR